MAKTNQAATKIALASQEAPALDTQDADQNIPPVAPETDAERIEAFDLSPEPLVEPPLAPVEPPASQEAPASIAKKAKAAEPPAPESKAPARKRIRNVSCKGRTVYCVSGAPMVFDADGVAEVSLPDYLHLKKIPGYDDVE